MGPSSETPVGQTVDQTDDSCPGPDPISVLGEAPCALRQGSHELPLTLLRLQREDSPAPTPAQVPTHAHSQLPGKARGGQGSPPHGIREARGDSVPERLGPGCPHFWAGTCWGSYCWSGLQQALNPAPPTGPALVPRPMPTVRDAERLGFLAAWVLDKWACPSAARWERSEDPGRPGRRPMWVGLDPTAPFPRWQGHASPGSQREGPFLQDCGLRGPHVTALGLPGQGQNQLSLPEAPEMRESRGSHLDGYSGRLVTSEGWAAGRQAPSLGVLSCPVAGGQ